MRLPPAARVLMVGAGGIGCELLKALVLAGAADVEVIDLDTIDVSNLNRQFLFRQRHVGQPKALVATESVMAFLPQSAKKPKIKAHHANIKQPEYGVKFFQTFDVVLNGLDNVDARRHVNRLCLAANVPLIESGTTGLLGQVTCHVKGVSACYECTPKAAAKTYPVCTLRNTPDKPIHTIVWAKDMLFKQLFGGAGVVTDLAEGEKDDGDAETQNADDAAKFFTPADGETPFAFLVRVFRRLYVDDINKVNSMDDLWEKQGRRRPLVLQADSYANDGKLAALANATGTSTPDDEVLGLSASAASALGYDDDHATSFGCASKDATSKETDTAALPPHHDARVFLVSGARLLRRRQALAAASGDDDGVTFDKDDLLATEFVSAASNLRSRCYGIPRQSVFDAKGMAGNIVHAVATTNAIVAGLIVNEAKKVLRWSAARKAGREEEEKAAAALLQDTFVVPFPSCPGAKYCIQPTEPATASASCYVCGGGAGGVTVTLDTAAWRLADLVAFLKKKLSIHELCLETEAAGDLFGEGEGLEDDEIERYAMLGEKALADLPGGGVADGTTLRIEDFSQDFKVAVLVRHKASSELPEEDYPERCIFATDGAMPAPTATQAPAPETNGESAKGNDDGDDDIEVLEDGVEFVDAPPPAKKARV